MKNVLLVVPTLLQGGGQKFVLDLAKGLDKEQFRVRVLVFFRQRHKAFAEFAEQNGIETVYLDKKKGLDLSFFRQVRKAIKEFQPDVIHSHLNTMLYLLPFYRKKQVKLHTVHTLAEKEHYGMQKLVNYIAFHWRGVVPVAISDTVAGTIANVHHLKPERIPVVYNGVDCARYDIPKVAGDTFNFVSVGTIYEVKNFPFLVDCFAALHKTHPETRLTIVGNGAQRGKLHQQIDALGLSEAVTITGTVGNVEDYLAAADVYVASSHFEGLPLSILEAMAAGLPVITTNVGGVPDVVHHGENGLLIPPGDPEAYLAALTELTENAEKRAALAARSKELSKNYDEELTIHGYESLYKKG
ncbi:MAG: glycosyltransferase [Ruminococcaceae bacterium]|nr:glycosyltransferase [Oscillospiraceae bacterium]